eukprot:SAG31_NODE_32288_length_357_cov_1.255814_1_plen_63_part_10
MAIAHQLIMAAAALRVWCAAGSGGPSAHRSCAGAPEDWVVACDRGDLLFVKDDCPLCVMPENR